MIEVIMEIVRQHNEALVRGPDMLKDRGEP